MSMNPWIGGSVGSVGQCCMLPFVAPQFGVSCKCMCTSRTPTSGFEQVVHQGSRSIPQECSAAATPACTAWGTPGRSASLCFLHRAATTATAALSGQSPETREAGQVEGEPCAASACLKKAQEAFCLWDSIFSAGLPDTWRTKP